MKQLGLIGNPLKHSFSKKYFAEKFAKEGIEDWHYDLYPLDSIDHLPSLLKDIPNLVGLNVTIPYKQLALKYMHELDKDAADIGAINTIVIKANGKLKGYNTDVIGFQHSLIELLDGDKYKDEIKDLQALVLGTGGAAKAIVYTLKKLNIPYKLVSRNPERGILYENLDEKIVQNHQLIINSTPLGTFPNINQAPPFPFQYLSKEHFLFDLVYNPEKTLFLQHGINHSAKTMNGALMLKFQAEASWDIWKKA